MKISFSKQTKERAFKQLYEEYYAPFCLYAKRFVDDKETREDIVSDVFTSLWDKLDTDSFDLQSNTALAYIKMCVKNNCLNFLKHQEYEWSYAENIKKKAPVYETEPDSVYTLDELYEKFLWRQNACRNCRRDESQCEIHQPLQAKDNGTFAQWTERLSAIVTFVILSHITVSPYHHIQTITFPSEKY